MSSLQKEKKAREHPNLISQKYDKQVTCDLIHSHFNILPPPFRNVSLFKKLMHFGT
jgi:hypothetical protein